MNPGVRSSANCSRCPRRSPLASPPSPSPALRGAHASTDAVDAAVGQGVGTLVAGVAIMAAHPMPLHVVLRRQSLQALPQFHVLHRLLVGGAPATLLPAVDPGR